MNIIQFFHEHDPNGPIVIFAPLFVAAGRRVGLAFAVMLFDHSFGFRIGGRSS